MSLERPHTQGPGLASPDNHVANGLDLFTVEGELGGHEGAAVKVFHDGLDASLHVPSGGMRSLLILRLQDLVEAQGQGDDPGLHPC